MFYHSYLVTLHLAALFFIALGYFCLAYHTFWQDNKSCWRKEYFTYSSQLDAVYNKYTVYPLYSSHASGDLVLIAVDQKDRALERTCSPYILKPIVLQSSDTLHCLITTINNYGSKATPIYLTHEFYAYYTEFNQNKRIDTRWHGMPVVLILHAKQTMICMCHLISHTLGLS